MTQTQVRITKDYDGDRYLLWAGETFAAMSGPPYDDGVEIKSAGCYLYVPAGYFEVTQTHTDSEERA